MVQRPWASGGPFDSAPRSSFTAGQIRRRSAQDDILVGVLPRDGWHGLRRLRWLAEPSQTMHGSLPENLWFLSI